MPITHDFEYYKPGSLAEAVKLLSEYKGAASVLAGGTDLIVWLKENVVAPRALVDIKGIKDLDALALKNGVLRIGARTTFSALIESAVVRAKFPVLWEMARTVASVGVRNRATLAGNICSAIPCLDSAPALLVYEAVVVVQGSLGMRHIPMAEWFVGLKKTARRPDEVVTRIEVPLPKKHGGCYVKLGRYAGEDLAQVGLAILALSPRGYRVAHCAVAPTPRRMAGVEALLASKPLTPALLKQACARAAREINPIADVRASKEYRQHMCGIMLARGLNAAAARLAGKGPAYGAALL
jgi:carbon-monoxide dehydrogenase medium subunit